MKTICLPSDCSVVSTPTTRTNYELIAHDKNKGHLNKIFTLITKCHKENCDRPQAIITLIHIRFTGICNEFQRSNKCLF